MVQLLLRQDVQRQGKFLFCFGFLVLYLIYLMEKIINLYYLAFRFPEKIGGNLPGVHYIRDVADADSLVSSLVILFILIVCLNFSG